MIQQRDKYLLIKRAAEPDMGLWSIPGGMVELGEKVADAAVREAFEETGLNIKVIGILDVIDKIILDDDRIKFHFIIVDFIAEYRSGKLKASSDALDTRWVSFEESKNYELSPTLIYLLKKIGIY